ncbi:MAG: response regulator [Candidatus Moranbacteria bacterium]|nr:response regulator [Candidatus Moranbacteria bacterium]
MENNEQNKPANILIVEDDSFISGLLQRKFAQEKYGIFNATNSEAALEVLKKNKIDLMLLDIILPGTDGIAFLESIKKDPDLKDIQVIITSNLGQPEEIERGLQTGAVDYIVKANTAPAEIVEKVKSVLKK